MSKKRQYLTKDEAAAKGWYCRSDLKRLFRLKPSANQHSAGEVWQGQGLYHVYDKALCVQMRPLREPSAAQLAALAAGRDLLGSLVCKKCYRRTSTEFLIRGVCDECRSKKLRG